MKTVFKVIAGGWESQEETYSEHECFLEARQSKAKLLETEKYVDYFYIKQVYKKGKETDKETKY